MTENDPQPHLANEKIRQAREELRIQLYKNSVSKRRGIAERVLSWTTLPFVVVLVLVGAMEFLRSKPMSPKLSALLCFMMAGLYLFVWKMGGMALRLSRRLARAIDNHLRQLDEISKEAVGRSEKARAATDVRHEANRKRKRDAKAHYWAKDWKAQADAARSIADSFNVTEKVAARWVAEWKREGNSAPKDGTSSIEE